jgi:hypothetical protein
VVLCTATVSSDGIYGWTADITSNPSSGAPGSHLISADEGLSGKKGKPKADVNFVLS